MEKELILRQQAMELHKRKVRGNWAPVEMQRSRDRAWRVGGVRGRLEKTSQT